MKIADFEADDVLGLLDQVCDWVRAHPDAPIKSIEIGGEPEPGTPYAQVLILDAAPDLHAWRAVRRALMHKCTRVDTCH